MKALSTKSLAAGLALAFAGSVQAAPITTWQVLVDTVFDQTSITASPGSPGVTFVSGTELRWGAPATSAGDSGLIIGNSPADTLVDTNGPLVANVSITHRNNPIFAGTGSLTSVDIASTLTLTPFLPASAGLPSSTLVFNVLFLETPNAPDPCADGTANNTGLNSNGCADIFVISQDSINFEFLYTDPGYDPSLTPETNLAGGFVQDRSYFISFLETTSGLNPLPALACTAAGATAPCLGFRTPEEATTTFQYGALITTERVQINVPEPGTLALLGLGLGALSLGLRRRRSQIEA